MKAEGCLELELQGTLVEFPVVYYYSYETGYSPEIEDVLIADTSVMDIVENHRPSIVHLVNQAIDDIDRRNQEAQDKYEARGDYLYQLRKDDRLTGDV